MALTALTEALAAVQVTECRVADGERGPFLSVRHNGRTMRVNATFGSYWQSGHDRHPGTYISTVADPIGAAQTVRARLVAPARTSPAGPVTEQAGRAAGSRVAL